MVTADAGQRILAALRERQQATGLSDAAFAGQLGISRAHWRFVLAGQRGLSERVLRGAMRVCPELAPQVLVFLSRD